MKTAVAAADTKEAKQAAATTASNKMSEQVYEKTVKMYNKLQKKQEARAWFGSLLNKNSETESESTPREAEQLPWRVLFVQRNTPATLHLRRKPGQGEKGE